MNSVDASTIRMLLERLNWPIREARLLAARELGQLLECPDRAKTAKDALLSWLVACRFESQVVSGLVVLLAASEEARPSSSLVARYILRPSILSDFLMERIYGRGHGTRRWIHAHSGVVPPAFVPHQYFLEHSSAHVPPIFGNRLAELEEATGLPFKKQWAYEWSNLADASGSPQSGFPYYFIDVSQARSGIIGQLSVQQSEIFRSAYLRTLACAVERWGMPAAKAVLDSTLALPVNRGLLHLQPVKRPEWLANLPERCCEPNAPLQDLARELLQAANQDSDWRLVSLRTPISPNVAQYAELSICGLLVTERFEADGKESERGHRHLLLWPLADGLTFNGLVDLERISDFTSEGRVGVCSPICLDVWPIPGGFWHSDLFQVGLPVSAPYLFETQMSSTCGSDSVIASTIDGGDRVASLSTWHDHWTPRHPLDGPTRCGMLTQLKEPYLSNALKRHGRRLQWFIELRMWKQAADYEPFQLVTRREYLSD
jgi:hypothetical protein